MLLIDAANVVGSRPTGWWRDRAGAAARLVAAVRAAVADGRLPPPVTIVLEGAARAGSEPGGSGGVEVVHAAGSGDDELAAIAAASRPGVTVLVSADRELRRRVEAVGATAVGPTWLWERIDEP